MTINSTLLFAGHETTTMSLAWCLYEIARNPQYQERIREEITAIRAKKGGEMLSTTDLDSMTYTVAILKVCWCYSLRRRAQMCPFVTQEALRLHPVVQTITRDANQDVVIPLASPIVTKSGEQVYSIQVRKGTPIDVAVVVYNR